MIEGSPAHRHLVNPYDIAFDKEYASTKLTPNVTIEAYKYMFVREPYGRLLSFYVDKLMASNTYYWKVVGIYAVKGRSRTEAGYRCGHDVSFPEFIKYVIKTLSTGKNVDPHWVEMERNCRTCDIRYDYIGKMETFAQNADEILIKLGLNKTAEYLRQHGAVDADEDAIKDSVVQPYVFENKYRLCISFSDALERAWKKLQIRGLVAPGPAPSHLSSRNSSWRDFFAIAKASRESLSKEERKQLKLNWQREYWAQIEVSDLLQLKRLYAKDFQLFDYDDHPDIVFQGRAFSETGDHDNNSAVL